MSAYDFYLLVFLFTYLLVLEKARASEPVSAAGAGAFVITYNELLKNQSSFVRAVTPEEVLLFMFTGFH